MSGFWNKEEASWERLDHHIGEREWSLESGDGDWATPFRKYLFLDCGLSRWWRWFLFIQNSRSPEWRVILKYTINGAFTVIVIARCSSSSSSGCAPPLHLCSCQASQSREISNDPKNWKWSLLQSWQGSATSRLQLCYRCQKWLWAIFTFSGELLWQPCLKVLSKLSSSNQSKEMFALDPSGHKVE